MNVIQTSQTVFLAVVFWPRTLLGLVFKPRVPMWVLVPAQLLWWAGLYLVSWVSTCFGLVFSIGLLEQLTRAIR